MRILILITRADEIGGAQTHVHDVAYHLQAKGHDILVGYGMKGKFIFNLEKNKIKTVQLPNLTRNISIIKDIKAIKEFRKVIKEYNPDVISCHSTKSGLVGRVAAYLENKKVIFTAHGWAFTEGVRETEKIIYSIVERMLSKITTAVINVSEYDRTIAIRNKIKCIHHVVHNCIVNRDYKINKFNEENIVISVVARFCAQKDHRTFIRALRLLDGKLNYKVYFIGAGDASAMKALATEYGVINKVVFMGEQSNVSELLDKTHIFCLPSNWEGFPISIIEAMRAGCAIIASDVGGVSESIKDRVDGILVARHDIDAWYTCLSELINNKSKIFTYALAARKRFENEFVIEKMIDKYDYIIKTC